MSSYRVGVEVTWDGKRDELSPAELAKAAADWFEELRRQPLVRRKW